MKRAAAAEPEETPEVKRARLAFDAAMTAGMEGMTTLEDLPDDVLVAALVRSDDLATFATMAQVNKKFAALIARIRAGDVAGDYSLEGMGHELADTIHDRLYFERNLRSNLTEQPLRVATLFRELVAQEVITGRRRWFHAYQLAMRIQWIGTATAFDLQHSFKPIDPNGVTIEMADRPPIHMSLPPPTQSITYMPGGDYPGDPDLRPRSIELKGVEAMIGDVLIVRNTMSTVVRASRNPANPRTGEKIGLTSHTLGPIPTTTPITGNSFPITIRMHIRGNEVVHVRSNYRVDGNLSTVLSKPTHRYSHSTYEEHTKSTLRGGNSPTLEVLRAKGMMKMDVDARLAYSFERLMPVWDDTKTLMENMFRPGAHIPKTALQLLLAHTARLIAARPGLTREGKTPMTNADFDGLIAGLDFFRHSTLTDEASYVAQMTPNKYKTHAERTQLLRHFNAIDVLLYALAWAPMSAATSARFIQQIKAMGIFDKLDARSTLQPVVRWDGLCGYLQCAYCAGTVTHVDANQGHIPLCHVHAHQ